MTRSRALVVLGIMAAAAGCSASLDVQLANAGAPAEGPAVQQAQIATVTPIPETASGDTDDSATASPGAAAISSAGPAPTSGPTPPAGPETDVGPTSTADPEPTATALPTATVVPTATATAVPAPTPTSTPASTPTVVPVAFVIGPDAALLGVSIGAEAETAMSMLVGVIGEPDFDSDWYVGCPLDGDELNERLVQWGDLNVYFERFDGTERFRAWGYGLRIVEGGFPEIDLIELPGGSRMGDPVNVVAAAAGLDVVYGQVFDINRVGAGGFEIVSDAPPGAPVWGAFVPAVPACE